MSAAQTPAQLGLEAVWNTSLNQLEAGSREIALPIDIHLSIGEAGVAVIAQRFQSIIKARPSILPDYQARVVRILPPPDNQRPAVSSSEDAHTISSPSRNSASSEGETTLLPDRVANNGRAKVAKERMTKVPRPPNAFILYRKHHHPDLKAANPDMHNNEISVIIGRKWQAEDALTKDCFKKKAEELKLKHKQDHPEYQYQPRKASDKKRRATKNKSSKSHEAESDLPLTPPGSKSVSPQHYAAFTPQMSYDPFAFMALDTTNAPSFDTSTDGHLIYDFDMNESGLLSAMSKKRNEDFPHLQSTLDGPSLLDMQFTDSAAHEHDYDEAMVPWGELETEAAAAHQKDLQDLQLAKATKAKPAISLDPIYDNRYKSAANYVAFWKQNSFTTNARVAGIEKELAPYAREHWGQVWDTIDPSKIRAEPTESSNANTGAANGAAQPDAVFPNYDSLPSSFLNLDFPEPYAGGLQSPWNEFFSPTDPKYYFETDSNGLPIFPDSPTAGNAPQANENYLG